MKFFRYGPVSIGAGIVLASTVWWLLGDFTQPLRLIIGTLVGVGIMNIAPLSVKLYTLQQQRSEERERQAIQAAEAQAEQDRAQKLAEASAVFDNIVLEVATPDKIEGALRHLADKRPDLATPLGELLDQFNEAHDNLTEIHNFELSNSRFSNDIPAFENNLADIAANSIDVINAVKLNTNIDETFANVITKNREVLSDASDAMAAMLAYANMQFAKRRANTSRMELKAIAEVYGNLATSPADGKEITN